jgi:hypothetical protein
MEQLVGLLGTEAKAAADVGVGITAKTRPNQLGELALERFEAPLERILSLLFQQERASLVGPAIDHGRQISQMRWPFLAAQVDDRVAGDLVQPGAEVSPLELRR